MYNPDKERRLREMGLVGVSRQKAAGTHLLGIGSTNSQDEDSQFQQQPHSENQELRREVEEKDQEVTQLQQQLTRANKHLTRTNEEHQQLIAALRQQLDTLSATNNTSNPPEVELWQVSPEEVSIKEDEILGRGYVTKGTFRGTTVAVKQVYPEILRQTTVDRIRREICTMAQIRHPLFVAAVLNEQTGPMIVTELLDTTLRSAYQDNRIGPNKRRIFGDISSALVYLHQQIIHRDVSSANVLLHSLPNNKWLAKLSDFGSANLARDATEKVLSCTLPLRPIPTHPHHLNHDHNRQQRSMCTVLECLLVKW